MSTMPNKSTTAEAQRERVLSLLALRPHTSHELTAAGIYHPPARIKELREAGLAIQTHRVSLIDRFGYAHMGCALYELHQQQQGGGL